MTNIKVGFDVWKSYVNKIGEMLLNDEYLISEYFKKDEENYKKFKDEYENNFIKYKTNQRFNCPIIGKISSGKSTFLNSILQGNFLSSASGIETKFICILRHNSKCDSPMLFKCELKQENLDYKYKKLKYYYFEKKDEIKGNILENIKVINENLSNYEKKISKNERDINKYFYILELNIPFFEENEELANYFDFMDIPGLNEKDDFYSKEIIPLVVNKCLFSIYIFDLLHYENEDTKEVYQNYSQLLNKFYKTNSIYILNKIDSIPEEDKKNFRDENYHFQKFKKYLSNEENQFNVDLNTNYFLKLNSKEVFNKVNAFSNIKTFISHICDTIKEEENDELFSFKNHLITKFKDYFQITDKELKDIFGDSNDDNYNECTEEKENENSNDEIYNKYFDEKEFDEIMDIINTKCQAPDFEELDYKKFKYIFVEKKKLSLQIPELNTIYEMIIGSMTKSIDEFLNWDHVIELMTTFKESINKIFDNIDERKKYNDICNNLLESFRKELEQKKRLKIIDWKPNILESLKLIIDSLIRFEPNNKALKDLKENFDSLTYFIYNYRKIRIPLLGGYSTGKSSFLNNMIGKDILPVDVNICTNRGIILRHNRNRNKPPQLFNTKFIQVTNPDYWYFKDEKEPICEGCEEVKKKLIELNSQKVEFENAFVVLKTHLNIFSELDFSNDKVLEDDLKEKLELIDFPGLDTSNNVYKEKIFAPLMRFSDGFIFMNECDLIQEIGNMRILTNIISQIRTRKFTFSYKSCLFLLHKLDKSLDLDINKSREVFDNIFIRDKNDKEELKVDKFSSKLYHTYIEFLNKYTIDFESYLNFIVGNLIKPEEKKTIKNFNVFLNIIYNISKKLKFQINKKHLKNYDEQKNNDNNLNMEDDKLNSKLFEKYKLLQLESFNKYEKPETTKGNKIEKEIYSNYLYLKKNHKIQNQRLLSNANSLFESLYILFKDSFEYTEKEFQKYFNYFIENFTNLFILIDLKIYGNEFKHQIIFNDVEKDYMNIKTDIEKFYSEVKKNIDKKTEEFKDKNNEFKNNFFSIIHIDMKENYLKHFGEFEKNVQSNINKFAEFLDSQQKELNGITNKLKLGNKKVRNIEINFTNIILNKDSKTTQLYEYHDNLFFDIFKGIGNFFIKINNYFNENKQIEKNVNKYLDEVNDLINNCISTYEEEINSRKLELLKKIDDNLEINNNKFEGIKSNRDEYENIKKNYYHLINNKV